MLSRTLFQTLGPATANARSPNVFNLVHGTKKRCWSSLRNAQRPGGFMCNNSDTEHSHGGLWKPSTPSWIWCVRKLEASEVGTALGWYGSTVGEGRWHALRRWEHAVNGLVGTAKHRKARSCNSQRETWQMCEPEFWWHPPIKLLNSLDLIESKKGLTTDLCNMRIHWHILIKPRPEIANRRGRHNLWSANFNRVFAKCWREPMIRNSVLLSFSINMLWAIQARASAMHSPLARIACSWRRVRT